MNIAELKQKYDGKQIGEIEDIARSANATQETQHKEFISALFYLENTSRFKENPAYRGATFAQYVEGFYGMAVQTYNRYRFAYFRYPEQSERFGPGTIMKIASQCGGEMVPKVTNEIAQIPRKQITKEKQNEIIEKYAKKRLKKRKARPTYSELERELVAEKKKNAELQQIIKEDKAQLERQAKTIEHYKTILGDLARAVPPEALTGLEPRASA